MKKKTHLLVAMTVFVLLIASACGSSAAPATQAVQSVPQVPPVQSVQTQAPAPLDVTAPTQQSAPGQTFAPACQTTSAGSCAAPDVAEKDTEVKKTYCVAKLPFQNIFVAPGTLFEVMDKSGDFKCSDSGTVVNGKMVIACTGKQLYSFNLKLTNPACGGASALTPGASQCQTGLGYDAGQNCCAPLNGSDSGSVIIKVNLGAC